MPAAASTLLPHTAYLEWRKRFLGSPWLQTRFFQGTQKFHSGCPVLVLVAVEGCGVLLSYDRDTRAVPLKAKSGTTHVLLENMKFGLTCRTACSVSC